MFPSSSTLPPDNYPPNNNDYYEYYNESAPQLDEYGQYGQKYQYAQNPTYDAYDVEEEEVVELQKPLDPREFQESDLNLSPTVLKYDNLPSILRHRGQIMQRQSAFITLDSRGKEISTLTWDKLASRAEKVAQVIRDKSGLYRGDRVALYYTEYEVFDFTVALMGCFLAGVVAVPMNPNAPFKDTTFILSTTQSSLVLTTDTSLKSLHRHLTTYKLQWPKGVEWWKTNEFGSYHPPKKADPPALQVPDLAYIEFSRSPVGELRGVVLSHRTILHQMKCLTAMLNSKKIAKRPGGRGHYVLTHLDVRQSVGLVIGVLLTIYNGNTTIYLPQQALHQGGLYANVISRYRSSILLSNYFGLKLVAYNYQSFPHLTRNYSKKQQVDLSSVQWCLIDAITVDTEFHEILQDRWFKPLGNKNYKDVVAPMLTLSEHGGMVIAMRDWLNGQEKLGCAISEPSIDDENCGPSDLSEVLLDKASLTSNQVKIITASPSKNSISEDSRKYVQVGAFGFPLPDATLAIVNPDTCILAPEMVLGEIWIDSPSLSGGFWGLSKETDIVFQARCYDKNGPVDMEFLRTGLLGFVFNGKVYALGLYEDRLRQRVDWTELEVLNGRMLEYNFHYTSHLVHTIMRNVSRVFDCSAFDTLVNGEYLPVLVVESSLGSVTTVPGQSPKYDLIALNEVAEKAIQAVAEAHNVRVYGVLITAPNALPRIMRSGRSEIGNMLCKRRFDTATLPAVFVKFAIDKAIRNLPIGQDVEGGIWMPEVSQSRSQSLYGAEKQYSGVDFRDTVIDERTSQPLSDFESIVHILLWRVAHRPDELAFKTIDNKSREAAGLSWKKFDRKVATVAVVMKNKLNLRPGNHVVLMYTHSEDFVVAVYACMISGVIAIPVAPIDSNRLSEDVPALLNIIKDYGIKAILLNNDTDAALKVKVVSQHLKQTASVSKIILPKMYNTNKPKVVSTGLKDLKMTVRKEWMDDKETVIVWLYWTPDHRRVAVRLNHKTIMSMAKIQKETCQMPGTKPVVGCVRSIHGLGFIQTCFMGVYLGASTLIVSPIDYAHNPLNFYLTLSRYKVKDVYATPQMLDHACATLNPKNVSLADTKNLIVPFDSRPRTDISKRVRTLFAPTNLNPTSISLAYSHILNPMITTRSYMSIEPVDIWLDPIALRQGYVSLVNPENFPNALHLPDSGIVPVGTQVAIVNPETCCLCKVGEYGEIWVYSEGNVSGFYKSKDQFHNERLLGKIVDGNQDVTYFRTGDLGFLHTVNCALPNSEKPVELQTLFVLGSIGDTFEVLGLNHFPQDVEASVEACHPNIVRGGTAVFQAGGLNVLVVEVTKTNFLAALVPVIVNTILDDHQFVIDIVAFVGKGDFPRSRLNEKQRGKLLASWVTKKLNVAGIYGVNQGDRFLLKSIFRAETPVEDVEEEDAPLDNASIAPSNFVANEETGLTPNSGTFHSPRHSTEVPSSNPFTNPSDGSPYGHNSTYSAASNEVYPNLPP